MKLKLFIMTTSLLFLSAKPTEVISDYKDLHERANEFSLKNVKKNISIYIKPGNHFLFADKNSIYVEYILSEMTPSLAHTLKNYFLKYKNGNHIFSGSFTNATDPDSVEMTNFLRMELLLPYLLSRTNSHQFSSFHEQLCENCDEKEKEEVLLSLKNRYNKFDVIS